MSLHVVILAAGQGRRMHSSQPKVLHKIGGEAMLVRVVNTAKTLMPQGIHVIYGHGGEQIKEALPKLAVNWVKQANQLGTGHAVMQALPFIDDKSQVLVLSADVPLIEASTLSALVERCTPQGEQTTPLGLLLASLENPTGLGRIVRDEHAQIQAIVEERDANEKQRQINEIYSGICCAKAHDLKRWLPNLDSGNAQGEYYLTEIIAKAVSERLPIVSLSVTDPMEILGVNNRLQLQQLERIWQQHLAENFMLAGVHIADGKRFDVRGTLTCGWDVSIDVNAVFEGDVVLGDRCQIGANCVLRDVSLGADCVIAENSVLEGCLIGDACQIGPFARIRPGTQLAEKCKIGNFVETKKATFGAGSKASHLSYLGDITVGKRVNIGAGTITCNYDGVNKHQTIIEDGVFVGSDTQLVAPVTVGANATIGAGSTIRKNVSAGDLALTEAKQKAISGWKRPVRS